MEHPVRMRNTACIVGLCAASVTIVACGGAAPKATKTTQTAVVAQRPQRSANASNLDIGRGRTQRHHGQAHLSERARPSQVSNAHRAQKARSTPALVDHDGSAATATVDPCKLVTLHEAQSITNGAITGSLEAPLGPTCVYRASRAKSDVTVAVETLRPAQVARSMTGRQTVTIDGHKAYCGRLGSPMLYVVLPGARMLHITAPCPVAQRFAATALSRLAA
jgi:hypothetical protein